MKITIFTPTYNRAYILGNLYRSLQRQTCREFEWLIIDDGSADNTEALVADWIREENDFPIRYFKVPNGGKHRAWNKALDLAEGELFFTVDSDDYLTEDAVQKILHWANSLPKNGQFCGVAGNLGTSVTESPNSRLPQPYFEGTALDRYSRVNGERAMVFFTDTHRKYPYPEFEGENFMTEAVTWNRMAHDGYQMRFYNDIIWIFEYLPDGLTRSGSSIFLKNPRGHGIFLREKAEFLNYPLIEKMKMWYNFYCDHTFCDAQYRLTKTQCAQYIGAPPAFIYLSALVHRMPKFIRTFLKKQK